MPIGVGIGIGLQRLHQYSVVEDLGSTLKAYYSGDLGSFQKDNGSGGFIDAVANADAISRIYDLTGNTFHGLQSTSGQKPIYHPQSFVGEGNTAGMEFATIRRILTPTGIVHDKQATTIFGVIRPRNPTNNSAANTIYQANSQAGGTIKLGYWVQGGVDVIWNGTTAITGPAPYIYVGVEPYPFIFRSTGGSTNNLLIGGRSLTNVTYTMISEIMAGGVIGNQSTGTLPLNGDVLEFGICDTIITGAKYNRLLARLTQRAKLLAPTRNKVLFGFGNSIYEGFGATDASLGMGNLIIAGLAPYGWDATNPALPGQTTQAIGTYAATDILRGLGGRSLGSFTQKYATLGTEPSNTMALFNLATTQSHVTACIAAIKAVDATIKVIVTSVLPRLADPAYELKRIDYNIWIAVNWASIGADMFIDLAADPDMGPPGSQNNPAFYLPDTVHPNNAGHVRLASYYIAALSVI